MTNYVCNVGKRNRFEPWNKSEGLKYRHLLSIVILFRMLALKSNTFNFFKSNEIVMGVAKQTGLFVLRFSKSKTFKGNYLWSTLLLAIYVRYYV